MFKAKPTYKANCSKVIHIASYRAPSQLSITVQNPPCKLDNINPAQQCPRGLTQWSVCVYVCGNRGGVKVGASRVPGCEEWVQVVREWVRDRKRKERKNNDKWVLKFPFIDRVTECYSCILMRQNAGLHQPSSPLIQTRKQHQVKVYAIKTESEEGGVRKWEQKMEGRCQRAGSLTHGQREKSAVSMGSVRTKRWSKSRISCAFSSQSHF